MIFKVFETVHLKALYEAIAEENRVIGPVEAALGADGAPIYSFQHIAGYDDLRLDYPYTKLSAKRYFMPYRETLSTFLIKGTDWDKRVDYNIEHPLVFFGMHACDINALNKLDNVLLKSLYPVPYYAAKRKNMFIVGIDCMPQTYCFCRSMGSDTVLRGFDIFLTELPGRYFASILSATAFEFLKEIPSRDPDHDDHAEYKRHSALKNSRFEVKVDTTDLTKILDMEFQSGVWQTWGGRCLSCGTCAGVCPTCYCYGVEEQVDIDLKSARKEKMLYSCNLVDFARIAGGHNFRPDSHTRLKYRYYHKHRGYVEAFEESLCVGCGRCGEACLSGITVPEVIASVREEV
jgi:ferredoxin